MGFPWKRRKKEKKRGFHERKRKGFFKKNTLDLGPRILNAQEECHAEMMLLVFVLPEEKKKENIVSGPAKRGGGRAVRAPQNLRGGISVFELEKDFGSCRESFVGQPRVHGKAGGWGRGYLVFITLTSKIAQGNYVYRDEISLMNHYCIVIVAYGFPLLPIQI